METFLNILSAGILDASAEQEWKASIPASMKRRDPRIWQMAYGAASRALDSIEEKPKSIVCATALGALDETKGYLDGIFKDGFGSPRHFIASVHNSMAGKLALEFKIDGPNLTVCEGQNSFASSLAVCATLNDSDFPSLVVVIDENTELLKTIQPYLSKFCTDYLNQSWNDSAVAFLLTNKHKPESAEIRSFGPYLRKDNNPDKACRKIASKAGLNADSLPALSKTSNSFPRPGQLACELYLNSQKGTHLIGSYSPSSDAVALIELCL